MLALIHHATRYERIAWEFQTQPESSKGGAAHEPNGQEPIIGDNAAADVTADTPANTTTDTTHAHEDPETTRHMHATTQPGAATLHTTDTSAAKIGVGVNADTANTSSAGSDMASTKVSATGGTREGHGGGGADVQDPQAAWTAFYAAKYESYFAFYWQSMESSERQTAYLDQLSDVYVLLCDLSLEKNRK